MGVIDFDVTPEERAARVDAILKRNSQPIECDFCTRKTWRSMTNIGSEEEPIHACRNCIATKRLLA